MFYNCHTHIFKDEDVPRKFLPLGLVRALSTKAGSRAISKVLNNINPFSDNDAFDRYVKFIEIGKLGSQQKIFEECKRFYPKDTKFIVLSMDMAYMGAGKVPRSFEEQLKKLAEVKKKYPQVIPFIHVDPRRPNVYDLFRKSVEEWGFMGVKLYPPLGYFPYDKGLYPVYEYCTQHNLPVLAHCSPFNPVHFKGKKKELLRLLSESIDPIGTENKSRKELCSAFTNPLNYKHVIKDFPKLRVCFGHFGSGYYWKQYVDDPGDDSNWFVIIRKMIQEYDNFYTDVSFTLNDEVYFSLLKIILYDEKIRTKVLFGSDYYMVETEASERRFGLDLRAYLGEELFTAIAVTNPERFLGLTD